MPHHDLPPWLSSDPLAQRLPHLDAEVIYDLAEEAAVLEFCGWISRSVAELTVTGGA